jgi:hypothetical protein
MQYFVTAILMFMFLNSVVFAQYSWQLKQSGSATGGPIDVERDNTNNVYFGSSGVIYKSIDRGETFSPMGNPIPGGGSIRAIISYPYNPSVLLVATSNRIVKTADQGINWTVVANNMSFAAFGIPMTPDPTHPDTVYTMNGANFLRSTDFGDTWTTISSNFGTGGPPCDIEVFPDTSIILVGDNGTGIFKSTDYGLTWINTHNTSGEIPTIAIDFQNPGIAWATRWGGGGGLLKSTDYGSTWTLQSGFGSINMWGVGVHPDDGNVVIAGCYSCGNTWRSLNGGQSWTSIGIASSNYRIVIVDSITQFAAQGNGFYKLYSPNFIPVELISFAASVIDNKVVLNWSTATEINNQGFDIEISYDNLQFDKIGFVPGYGSTTEQRHYSFAFDELITAKTYFRLRQIDFDGSFEYSPVVEADAAIPADFYLSNNYPNPFNPDTRIQFSLPVDAVVKIRLYNLLGELVSEIVNKEYSSGTHSVNFYANNLSSGTYFYAIEATGLNGATFIDTKKMNLLK